MKLQLFLFFLLLYSGVVIGQQKLSLLKQIISEKRFESTYIINAGQPKTIQNKAFDKYNSDFLGRNRLPYILALSISTLFLFINVFVVMHLSLAYKKYLQLQNESEERNSQYQIDKSIEFQQQCLRTIIATTHKQEWLNDVRICISNFLTNIEFVKPKVKDLHENENFTIYIQNVLFYKSKVEILLSEHSFDEKEVLKAIDEFSKILTVDQFVYNNELFLEKRNNLLRATRHFYRNHQKKLKYK